MKREAAYVQIWRLPLCSSVRNGQMQLPILTISNQIFYWFEQVVYANELPVTFTIFTVTLSLRLSDDWSLCGVVRIICLFIKLYHFKRSAYRFERHENDHYYRHLTAHSTEKCTIVCASSGILTMQTPFFCLFYFLFFSFGSLSHKCVHCRKKQ